MVRFSFCFFFLLLSAGEISSQLGSGPHITGVNILLSPKTKNPVEYRIQGSDGCFKCEAMYAEPHSPVYVIMGATLTYINNNQDSKEVMVCEKVQCTAGSALDHSVISQHSDLLPQGSESTLNNAVPLQVSLEAHIVPQNPVIHTGNLLNFSIAGTEHQISGQWVTSNRNVLSVNVASGQAKAISQGSAHVTFEGHGLKLQTEVTVLLGNTICPANSGGMSESETGPENVDSQSILEVVTTILGCVFVSVSMVAIAFVLGLKIDQAKLERKLEQAKQRNLK